MQVSCIQGHKLFTMVLLLYFERQYELSEVGVTSSTCPATEMLPASISYPPRLKASRLALPTYALLLAFLPLCMFGQSQK